MPRAAGIAGIFVVASLALAPVNAQQHLATPKPSGGALAASNYQRAAFTIGPGVPLSFTSGGVSFGSGISTTGAQFSSFILQLGIYQIHLSGVGLGPGDTTNRIDIMANLNSVATTSWRVIQTLGDGFDIVGGDRLVSVGAPNTTLQFFTEPTTSITPGKCWLIITRLQ
jgi:hypothetical protein